MAKYYISIYKSVLSTGTVDISTDLLMSLGEVYTSNDGKSVVVQESDSTTFATYDEDGSWLSTKCEVSLSWLKSSKRMFEPSCVEFEVQVSPRAGQTVNVIDDKSDILAAFMRHRMSVRFVGDIDSSGESSGTMQLAKDFYITSILPTSGRPGAGSRNSTSSYYLRVKAHSLDYYLTQNKHSEVYLGKSVSTLFNSAVSRFSFFTSDKYDAGCMRQLKKWRETTETDSNDITTNYYNLSREAIVPYVVQYNESTYDFLRRVASRYGEYLYFEDGVLRLGLNFSEGTLTKDAGKYQVTTDFVAPKISSYLSLEYDCVDDDDPIMRQRQFVSSSYTYGLRSLRTYSPESVESDASNSDVDSAVQVSGTSSNLKNNPDITYADFVSDEPLDPTFFHVTADSAKSAENSAQDADNSDSHSETSSASGDTLEKYLNKGDSLYTRLEDYSPNSRFWATTVFNALASPDYGTMLEVIGWGAALNYGISAQTRETMNGVFNTWTGYDKDNKSYADGVLYNNWDSVRDTDFSFLSIVQIESDSVAKSKITFHLGGYACDGLKLGDIFMFGSSKYIAIDITTKTAINHDSILREGVEMINPLSDINLTIVAVPYNVVDKVRIFPPRIDCDPIRKSEPQLAYIADNKDPRRMNRVRVCYPWQSNYTKGVTEYNPGSDPERVEGQFVTVGNGHTISDFPYASPWIRLSMPFASGGSGFSFLPNNGDEVMVNFEGGNIERPYVDGSLFTKDVPISKSAMGTIVKSITTCNGQSIYMTDSANGSNFIAKMSGMLGFVSGFAPGFMGSAEFNSSIKELDGNIELTDKYGIYSVKMSTTDRQVSVSSPLGNVVINAFTGISLSAPNGNISITGKNVTISAGNELKIESGTNINSKATKPSDYLMGATKAFIKQTVGTACDFSLVRIMWESLFKPLSGTMTIKSNRYLLVGAGKGSATPVSKTAVANRGEDLANRALQFPVDYFTDALQRMSSFLSSLRSYVPNQLMGSLVAYAKLRSELKPMIAALSTQVENMDKYLGDAITDATLKGLITDFATKFVAAGAVSSTTKTIDVYFGSTQIKAMREQSPMFDVTLLQRVNNLIDAHNHLISESARFVELPDSVYDSLYDAAFGGSTYYADLKDEISVTNCYIVGTYNSDYSLSTKVANMRAAMVWMLMGLKEKVSKFSGFSVAMLGVTLDGIRALNIADVKTINNNWANFTRSISEAGGPPTNAKILAATAMAVALSSIAPSAMPYKNFKSVNATGEILFSNKPNQTLHFDRNNRVGLHPAASQDNALGEVARILGGM